MDEQTLYELVYEAAQSALREAAGGGDPRLLRRFEDGKVVFIDGQAYYGDAALEAATAVNGECEMYDACGVDKFVCLANTPGATTSTARAAETVADIEAVSGATGRRGA